MQPILRSDLLRCLRVDVTRVREDVLDAAERELGIFLPRLRFDQVIRVDLIMNVVVVAEERGFNQFHP